MKLASRSPRRLFVFRVLPVVKRWRLQLLLAGVVLSIALGWWGFALYLDQTGNAQSGLNTLFYALGLFTFDSVILDGPVPVVLNVARVLAPTTVLAAAAGAVVALFDREIQRFRAGFSFDGHTIIVGLGQRALRLAMDLEDRGVECVIVEVSPDGHPHAPAARRAGIPVVGEEGAQPDLVTSRDLAALLRRARVTTARQVIVTTESPRLTARAANAMASLHDDGVAADAFIDIADNDTMRALQAQPPRREQPVIEYFNLAERGAKALLDPFEVQPTIRDTNGLDQHLVVVGSTELGRSIVVQAVRNWARDLAELDATTVARPRVTLVDPDDRAGAHELALLRRWEPRVAAEGEPGPCTVTILSDTPTLSALMSLLEQRPAQSVVIADEDEHAVLRYGLMLAPVLATTTHLSLCVDESDGLADLAMHEQLDRPGATGRVFHLYETVLRHDEILRGMNEELAIALHQDYLRIKARVTDKDSSVPASMVQWQELGPDFRENNRAAVKAWRRALRANGYRVVPYRTLGAESEPLPAEMVRALARASHEGWLTAQRNQGRRFGEQRDDDKLLHPDIMPWIQLERDRPTSVRFNQEQAAKLPQILAGAGFQLERLNGTILTQR